MRLRLAVVCAATVIVTMAFFTLSPGRAAVAEVHLSRAPSQTGSGFDGTLSLNSAGNAISGLQLDVVYDPGLADMEVEAMDSLTAHGKEVSISRPSKGILRILVIGSNPDRMPDAPFARLTSRGQPTDQRVIRFANVFATSPEAQNIKITATDSVTARPADQQGGRSN